jgi:hypothetical protein
MQQPRRLDGRPLIPADTRNKCVEVWHDYCPKGKWIVKVLGGRFSPRVGSSVDGERMQ